MANLRGVQAPVIDFGRREEKNGTGDDGSDGAYRYGDA